MTFDALWKGQRLRAQIRPCGRNGAAQAKRGLGAEGAPRTHEKLQMQMCGFCLAGSQGYLAHVLWTEL